jgi:two-component system invasion response regulator UvrY
MKNILIADDHSIIRIGLKSIVRKNYDVNRLDENEDENEITNLVKKFRYDLIILDINMPNSDFMKTLEWICIFSKDTNVLVFSMHEEQVYGLRCLNLGAKGYLNKACCDKELITAIKTTMTGKRYLSPALTESLLQSREKENVMNPFVNLSSRELEIALFLDKGIGLPKICSILNIQYSTGNTYKRRILEKLNVQNVLSLSRLMSSYDMVVC